MKSTQKILRRIKDLQNSLQGGQKIDPEWFNSITMVLEEILCGVSERQLEISKQLLGEIKYCLDMIRNINFSKTPLTQMGINALDKVMDGIVEELTIINFNNN